MKIACPRVAHGMGFISPEELLGLAEGLGKSSYGRYLRWLTET